MALWPLVRVALEVLESHCRPSGLRGRRRRGCGTPESLRARPVGGAAAGGHPDFFHAQVVGDGVVAAGAGRAAAALALV